MRQTDHFLLSWVQRYCIHPRPLKIMNYATELQLADSLKKHWFLLVLGLFHLNSKWKSYLVHEYCCVLT